MTEGPTDQDTEASLRARQDGVVSRRQLLEGGATHADLRRRLRRRELTVHAPGVYVDHTGPLTWAQRAWVAVLTLWPAALCHRSAVDPGGPSTASDAVIHVAVDRRRSVAPPPGVRVHHLTDLDERVQWHRSPPRVRLEHAVVAVAAESRDDLSAVAALADAVQSRRTTPERLRAALDQRVRVARRQLMADCLDDLAEGACSALEQAYLQRVERPHGLPTAERQVRASSRGPIYRDVEYALHHAVVELDGRAFHDDARSRDHDLERDLDATLEQKVTVRLGWGQVVGRPCTTAAKLATLLRQRGWTGPPRRCPRCPEPEGESGAPVPPSGVNG